MKKEEIERNYNEVYGWEIEEKTVKIFECSLNETTFTII